MTTQLYWTHPGTKEKFPLYEAEYDTSFKVFKSDVPKSVISDPFNCIEARGLKKMANVLYAHIGSGKSGIVVYKKTASRPFPHAVHFNIPAKAAKVRDTFDLKGAPETQVIMLRAPAPSKTQKYSRDWQKIRRAEVKAGTAPEPKRRGTQKNSHIARFGVTQRPRPIITKEAKPT